MIFPPSSLTLQEQQNLHMGQLTNAFGVANAQAVAKDSRLARMEGIPK